MLLRFLFIIITHNKTHVYGEIMKEFYLSIDRIGNELHERYIDCDGVERKRVVEYQPTLFTHAQSDTISKYKDIYGQPCLPKKFVDIKSANEWVQKTKGIVDVLGMNDYILAYISDTYKNVIEYNKKYVRIANCDIEVTATDFPHPNLALFEIDAITHYDSIHDKYYVFDLLNSQFGSVSKWDAKLAARLDSEGGDEVPQELLDKVVYMDFNSEREMLLEYINFWEQNCPVIFTGWNVEGFDIPYIMNRVKNVLGPSQVKRFSPNGKVTSKTITNMYGDKEVFSISGVVVLDYLDLYKKFSFTNQPSYKLDFIAKAETKRGKLEYDGPIQKLRETNHQRYISYNIMDVESVQAIDVKRGFINLSLSLAYYSKMNIDGVMSTLKTWDAIIFNSLKEENIVVPENKHHVKMPFPGAFVKEPKVSKYEAVMSFDLTSLYPSIIRQCNISPEMIAGQFPAAPLRDYINKTAPKPSDVYSCTPNGMMYYKDVQGVIPRETAKVFYQRKEWKGYMMTGKRNLELIKKALEKFDA